jgi:thiamine biosynthesis protein ThiS
MNIKINGQSRVMNSYITLRELLTIMNIDALRCVIKVNNELVGQHSFETFALRAGDNVDYESRVTGIPQISPNFIF